MRLRVRYSLLTVLCLLTATSLGCEKPQDPSGAKASNLALDPAQPRKSEEARAILAAAIRAHGGRDNLARLRKAGRIQSTMVGSMLGVDVDVTMEDTFQFPGQFKKVLKGRFTGQGLHGAAHISWAIDGDHAWFQKDGEEAPVLGSPDPERQFHPFVGIEQLISDSQWEHVDLLEERRVDGKILVGVKLRNWEPDAEFFFDKETSLLTRVREEKRLTVPDFDRKTFIEMEGTAESVHSQFKVVEGLHLPMKLESFLNGKKTLEIRVQLVEFVEEFEDSVFAKPPRRE